MVQISAPWDGLVTGDTLDYTPYTSDFWSGIYEDGFNSDTLCGVLPHWPTTDPTDVESLLAQIILHISGKRYVGIEAGSALVKGRWFHNDSRILFDPPIPGKPKEAGGVPISAYPRTDRIVLSVAWRTIGSTLRLPNEQGGRTIRIIYKINPRIGTSTPPSLTQEYGVLWEIPLYKVVVQSYGPATITNERSFAGTLGRKKTVFIPCCGGYNITDGLDIVPSDYRGVPFSDNKISIAYAHWYVPQDVARFLPTASTLSTEVVLSPWFGDAGTGAIYGYTRVYGSQCSQDYNYKDTAAGVPTYKVYNMNNFHQVCVFPLNLAGFYPGDILHLGFLRDATDPSDTFDGRVQVGGFKMTYISMKGDAEY